MELQLNGHAAYAYTGGKPFDAALPCVVFIHGALNDHSVWSLAARWFAHHGHSVLALDLPAHGRSGGAPPADVASAAAWVLQLLDALGVQRAAFVGHSMGSLIALEAAAQAPQRASHLVLVGTAYPMKVSDALLNTSRDAPLKAIDMVNVFSHSSIAAKPSYPGPGMWLHGAARALMRRTQAGWRGGNLFHHDFSVCNGYAGGLEAAAKVSCPTTLLLGQRDQMTSPKATAELRQALAQAPVKLATVPAGHAMMQEDPDGVLAALRSALA
jgi:pimeloyl-ACP methyl ester carboxylesterase